MVRRLTTHRDFARSPNRVLLSRIFRYISPYRWRWATAISIFVLSTIVFNLFPVVDRKLIDEHIAIAQPDGFAALLILAVGLHVLHHIGLAVRQIILGRVGHSIGFDMRRQLFEHVHRLSFSFFESVPVGSVMTRFLSDLATMTEFLAWQMAGFIHDTSLAIVTIALMFIIDARLAAVVLVTLPALIILAAILRPRIHKGWELTREAGSNLNVFLAENISGMRVIQAFVRQNVNLAEFARKNEIVVGHYMYVMKLQAWFQPVVEFTRAAGLCAVMLVAAQQGGAVPALSVGVLVAFTTYINNLWTPINTITNMYVILQATLTSATRAFAILDEQPTIKDAPDALPMPRMRGEIEFDGVTFGYDPQRPVLKDIHLHITPGQMVALVGHTGSGKTTIASLVARFYDVTGGSVRVDGRDVRTVQQKSLRSHMGVVLQEPFIFGDTIANNIRYGRPEAPMESVVAAAKLANAHDFIIRQESGYDTIARERGSQFSQGQRQLISIARALLADPRILILDEATSSVDTQTEMLIQQALERLLKGRTSLVIAHRLSTIRNADLIIVLDHGEIMERGTHATLMANEGPYARLVEAQMRVLP